VFAPSRSRQPDIDRSVQKKIRVLHAKEKQQIRERAGTRIALTCKFGQPAVAGVRIFYDEFVAIVHDL
jgi:hypothetical protein